jgi:hypothetical protein
MTKALWDLVNDKLVQYPRYDDEPVVGLDTSRYATVSLVREPNLLTTPSKNIWLPPLILT